MKSTKDNNLVTVVIHARNAQSHIEQCIASAKLLTSSIVVVDASSTDNTRNIAEKMGTIIFSHAPNDFVEPARNFDIEKAPGQWVFVLDADERITKELASEIHNVLSQQSEITSYRIPRKNIFAGKKWLQYGGWWPDTVSGRLIYKPSFITWPKEIHSKPEMRGVEGSLHQPFLHYFHSSMENMVKSTIVYENIEAGLLSQANRTVRTVTFFRKFIAELTRRLILKQGFLDGTCGVIESVYQAYSKTITWLFLFEKKHT